MKHNSVAVPEEVVRPVLALLHADVVIPHPDLLEYALPLSSHQIVRAAFCSEAHSSLFVICTTGVSIQRRSNGHYFRKCNHHRELCTFTFECVSLTPKPRGSKIRRRVCNLIDRVYLHPFTFFLSRFVLYVVR